MIIDAHNHPDWHKKDMDQVLADMDACGIDQTWMLTWECPEDEYDPDQRNLLNEDSYGSAYPVPFSGAWHIIRLIRIVLFWDLRLIRGVRRRWIVWKQQFISMVSVSMAN